MSEKILVVDDHAETRNLVAVILKRLGYDVHMAESGPVGLEVADRENPDLVLLDVMMPEMDGYEVCRRLRGHPQLKEVPIIMFTAKSRPSEKWEGFEAGANDYLVKPTNTEELGKRVRTILDNSNSQNGQAARQESGALSLEKLVDDDVTIVDMITPLPMPSTRSSKITAVIGARGGSGTTTTAINMAVGMAEGQQETILVDLDQVQGHISLYLNQQVTGGVSDLATIDPNYMEGEILSRLIPYKDNLNLLLNKPNITGRRPILEPLQTKYLAETLGGLGQNIIVDGGCGVTEFNQPFIEQANRVVVCLQPERVSVSAAKQLLVRVNKLMGEQCELSVFMLDFTQGVQLPKAAVEKFIGARLNHVISIEQNDMVQAVNSGRPLVLARPKSAAANLFRTIARELAPQ